MPTIHHAVLIGASSEKTYEALTAQEGLSKWWTPKAAAIAEVDSIARFPFGDNYGKEMRILELRPYELVRWNCIKGADEWVGTNISFKLETAGKSSLMTSYPEMGGQLEQQEGDTCTLLIFVQDKWRKESLMFAECNYTWGRFLRSLKRYCETGTGTPWPHQHRT